jgi:hypothetical protein
LSEYACAVDGMPQALLGIAKRRLPPPGMNGPPKGPAGRRVSVTRHGIVGKKCKPDTTTFPLVPRIEAANASAAVSVCGPAVTSVAEKVPMPFVRVVSAGSDAK